MSEELAGRKVVFVTANEGIEQSELQEPWRAVQEAGGQPVLAANKAGKAQLFEHLDKAQSVPVDLTSDQLRVDDYAGLVVPGGVANADQLRMDEAAVAFVRQWFDAGKPAAVICHGPWVLVEAGVVEGRTLTSWPSLKSDIANAGGNWVDKELMVCTGGPNVLVTSRKPDDLPAFCAKLVEVFAEQARRAAA